MATIDIAMFDRGTVTKVYDLTTLLTSYANGDSWWGPDVCIFQANEFSDPSLLGWYAYGRGLIQFDTSSLAGETITKVELYRSWLPFFSPGEADTNDGVTRNYEIKYSIGDFGSTLTYDQAAYDGGTDCFTEAGVGSSFTNGIFLDLGALGISGINTAGKTTIKIRNTYNDSFPVAPPDDSDGRGAYFSTFGAPDPCYLRITTQDAIPGCSPLQILGGY